MTGAESSLVVGLCQSVADGKLSRAAAKGAIRVVRPGLSDADLEALVPPAPSFLWRILRAVRAWWTR